MGPCCCSHSDCDCVRSQEVAGFGSGLSSVCQGTSTYVRKPCLRRASIQGLIREQRRLNGTVAKREKIFWARRRFVMSKDN